MFFKRSVLPLLICSLSFVGLRAQNTLGYTEADVHFRNGVELFEKSNYAAAKQEFRYYLEKRPALLNTNDYTAVTAEYYTTLCALYADAPEAELAVDRFVRNHPEHPKAALIYSDLGKYYFDREDYSNAITYLTKALDRSSNYYAVTETRYKLGLSYYSLKQYNPALQYFAEVQKDPASDYFAPAGYYAGVIQYQNGKYDDAYKSFKSIETHPQYKADAPNWIVSSLYQVQRYDDLIAYAEPLLRRTQGGGVKLNDVALYAAEVSYNRGKYEDAAKYYAQYVQLKGRETPTPAPIQFRYGHSLFRMGNYAGAVDQLKSVATRKDTTGQFGSYILAISHLQNKNPQASLTGFDNASKLKFNKVIQEEASFNHAKVQLELNNHSAAFTELQEFIKNFPGSEYEEEATRLSILSLTKSNNSAAAVAYIEKLKKVDEATKAAYQRQTMNLGIADFNAERYAQAIVNFDKSLKYTPDTDIAQAANFQKGEAFSALNRYGEAIPIYQQLIRNSPNSSYAIRSLYSLGYAYYNTKDYKSALTNFQQYVSKGKGVGEPQTIEDATIRMADSYLTDKNYAQAMALYDKALSEGRLDRDYALYQKGLILTYQEKDTEAKAQFDKVIAQFPTSRYADDALFQSANIDLEKGNYQAAIRAYTRLVKDKPRSYLIPPALLKRALAYNNIQVFEEAIRDYKRILSEYSDAPAAKEAMLGLQATLENAGRNEEMSDVLADYKKKNPQSTETERIEFETAKGLYGDGKYPQAIKALQNFIRDYPNSKSATEARYLGGESYYRNNDLANALKLFNVVIGEGDEKFTPKAALRAGDIEVQQQNYSQAVRNFYVLYSQSESKTDQVTGLIRLMDTYFVMKKYDSTLHFAKEVINAGDVIPGSTKKAQMQTAKVYLEKADYKIADAEFKKIIAANKDEFGAEAKYWASQALYRQEKYKEAQASIMELNKQFADYERWRVRAFILLADVYVSLKDPDQAKATLQSVIENAEDKDAIELAKTKLAALQ
ncbi:tetratricopeptide repeat protein [Runella sp.]|jgi:TolA-binding protein|uniref:tetratricopeptide repeat protein n=1 Tax=Runella sp. TaxID=1960881 RepID=UPI00261AC7FB|nr:tetratricopeptide repeat protein [Runella sp.]